MRLYVRNNLRVFAKHSQGFKYSDHPDKYFFDESSKRWKKKQEAKGVKKPKAKLDLKKPKGAKKELGEKPKEKEGKQLAQPTLFGGEVPVSEFKGKGKKRVPKQKVKVEQASLFDAPESKKPKKQKEKPKLKKEQKKAPRRSEEQATEAKKARVDKELDRVKDLTNPTLKGFLGRWQAADLKDGGGLQLTLYQDGESKTYNLRVKQIDEEGKEVETLTASEFPSIEQANTEIDKYLEADDYKSISRFKEGDTRQSIAGNLLVLRGGKWRRVNQDIKEKGEQAKVREALKGKKGEVSVKWERLNKTDATKALRYLNKTLKGWGKIVQDANNNPVELASSLLTPLLSFKLTCKDGKKRNANILLFGHGADEAEKPLWKQLQAQQQKAKESSEAFQIFTTSLQGLFEKHQRELVEVKAKLEAQPRKLSLNEFETVKAIDRNGEMLGVYHERLKAVGADYTAIFNLATKANQLKKARIEREGLRTKKRKEQEALNEANDFLNIVKEIKATTRNFEAEQQEGSILESVLFTNVVSGPSERYLGEKFSEEVHDSLTQARAKFEQKDQAASENFYNVMVPALEGILAANNFTASNTPIEKDTKPDVGLKADVTQKERKANNKDALELATELREKGRTATEEEKEILAKYSGQGGVGASNNEFYTPPELASVMWGILDKLGVTQGKDNIRGLEPSMGTGVMFKDAPEHITMTGVELMPTSGEVSKQLWGDKHDIHNMAFEDYSTTNNETFNFVMGNPPFGVRTTSMKDMPEVKRHEHYFMLKALDKLEANGVATLIVPAGIARNKGAAAMKFRKQLLAKGEVIAIHGLPNSTFERAGTKAAATDLWVLKKRDPKIVEQLEKDKGKNIKGFDTLGLLNEVNQDFLDGKYHERFPENVHGTEGKRGIYFSREGDLEKALEGIRNSSFVSSEPVHTIEDLKDAVTQKANTNEELYEGIAKIETGKLEADSPKEGDIKEGEDGHMLVLRNGRWHIMNEEGSTESVAPAIRDADNLNEVIGTLNKLKASGDTEGVIRANTQLKSLAKDFLRKHGNPHEHEGLQEGKGFNRLKALINKDGSLVIEAHEEKAVDYEDSVSLYNHLLKTNKAVSFNDLLENYQGDADLAKDLIDKGFCLAPDGEQLIKEQYYFSGDGLDIRNALQESLEGALEDYQKEFFESQLEQLEQRLIPPPISDMNLALTAPWIPQGMLETYLTWFCRSQSVDSGSKSWASIMLNFNEGTKQYYADSSSTRMKNFVNALLTGKKKRSQDKHLYDAALKGFSNWAAEDASPEAQLQLENAYIENVGSWLTPSYTSDLEIEGWNEDVTLKDYQKESVNKLLSQKAGILALDVGLGKTFTSIALVLKAKQEGLVKSPFITVPKSVLPNWRKEFFKAKPDANILIVGATPVTNEKGETLLDDEGKEIWDETSSADKLDAQLQQAIQGNYDAVILTHTTLSRIPLNPEQQLKLMERHFKLQEGHIAYTQAGLGEGATSTTHRIYSQAKVATMLGNGELTLEDIEGYRRAEEQLSQEIKLLNEQKELTDEEKLTKEQKKELKRRASFFANGAKELAKAKGANLSTTWDELGVDMLIADEGHNYKNLWEYRGGNNTPRRLGVGQSSGRAQDFFYKIAEMKDRLGEDAYTYPVTATPVKNSPVEAFNMLQYVAPEAFESVGVRNVNDFVTRYCVIETVPLDNADGTITEVPTLTGLQNLQELRGIMGRYIHHRTAEQVGLKIPDKKSTHTFEDVMPEQESAIQKIATNPMGAISEYLGKAPPESNMKKEEFIRDHKLALMQLLGRAELDLELLNPHEHKGFISPKVDQCTTAIKTALGKGETTVLFCDTTQMSDPTNLDAKGKKQENPHGYSFHEKLKNIIAKKSGISPDEIAIVNAKATPKAEQRQEVSEGVRSGKYKVVIGNTATMGEGINLQYGVKNLFHLNTPYNPAILQQREGRVVRQGNKISEVNNQHFLSSRGFDNYMHEMLKGKTNWYNEFWHGQSNTLDAGGDIELGNAEFETLAIKDSGERKAKLDQLSQERKETQERLRRLQGAKEFETLKQLHRRLETTQRMGAPSKAKTTKIIKEQIKSKTAKLQLDPNMKHLAEHLDNPLKVVINPLSGEAVKEGQKVLFASGEAAEIASADKKGISAYFIGLDGKRKRDYSVDIGYKDLVAGGMEGYNEQAHHDRALSKIDLAEPNQSVPKRLNSKFAQPMQKQLRQLAKVPNALPDELFHFIRDENDNPKIVHSQDINDDTTFFFAHTKEDEEKVAKLVEKHKEVFADLAQRYPDQLKKGVKASIKDDRVWKVGTDRAGHLLFDSELLKRPLERQGLDSRTFKINLDSLHRRALYGEAVEAGKKEPSPQERKALSPTPPPSESKGFGTKLKADGRLHLENSKAFGLWTSKIKHLEGAKYNSNSHTFSVPVAQQEELENILKEQAEKQWVRVEIPYREKGLKNAIKDLPTHWLAPTQVEGRRKPAWFSYIEQKHIFKVKGAYKEHGVPYDGKTVSGYDIVN